MTQQRIPQIYISFHDRDKAWFQRLHTLLAPFVAARTLHVSSRLDALAGDRVEPRLHGLIDGADLFVLLLSPDYLAEADDRHGELSRILARVTREDIPLRRLPVRACFADATPVAAFPALYPSDLAGLKKAAAEAALMAAVRTLGQALDLALPGALPAPARRRAPAAAAVLALCLSAFTFWQMRPRPAPEPVSTTVGPEEESVPAKPRTAELRGIVVDPEGRPVSGARIHMLEQETVLTDAEGRFRITLPTGKRVWMRVEKDRWSWSGYPRPDVPLVLQIMEGT